MKTEYAQQIAELLNSQNKLARNYVTEMILDRADDFIYELKNDAIAACIEAKKIQWYQWEVCHLTVAPKNRKQGLGSLMIQKAEERAKNGGARVIQCTIRVGNEDSERAFEKTGYKQVSEFYYSETGNNVAVWQKVVSTQPKID